MRPEDQVRKHRDKNKNTRKIFVTFPTSKVLSSEIFQVFFLFQNSRSEKFSLILEALANEGYCLLKVVALICSQKFGTE